MVVCVCVFGYSCFGAVLVEVTGSSNSTTSQPNQSLRSPSADTLSLGLDGKAILNRNHLRKPPSSHDQPPDSNSLQSGQQQLMAYHQPVDEERGGSKLFIYPSKQRISRGYYTKPVCSSQAGECPVIIRPATISRSTIDCNPPSHPFLTTLTILLKVIARPSI